MSVNNGAASFFVTVGGVDVSDRWRPLAKVGDNMIACQPEACGRCRCRDAGEAGAAVDKAVPVWRRDIEDEDNPF